MTLTNKIAKHTTIQIVGRFIGFALSLISVIFLTRYLKTEGFGQYITITVFVNAVAVFAEFGIDQILIKEFFKTKNKQWLVGNILGLRICFALLIFIIGALFGYLFPYAEIIRNGIWIYSLASFIIALELIFLDIFQINLAMHYQVIAETINRMLTVVLIVISIYFNLGLLVILFGLAISSAIQFLLAYFWVNKLIKIRARFDFKLWKSIMIKAFPLAVSAILIFIYYKVDTVILSVMKPSYDVGIYGAAYKILDIVSSFPAIFCGLVFPVLAGIYAHNKIKRFNKLIQKSFDVLVITGIPVSIIMFGMAKPIILLIAGNQFTSSIVVLQILSPTAILIFLNWIFWMALVSGDKQKALILPYIFISIFNIILNLLLIPHFSYFGAAVATVITQFFALIIPWVMTKKFFQTSISMVVALKTIIAGIVMSFFFIIIQKYNLFINWRGLENINTFNRLWILILATLVGSTLYLGILFALGGINKSIIKKVIRT